MSATVELVMDLTEQRHKIGLVTPHDRVEMTPDEVAVLITDLSTGMNLALTTTVHPERKPATNGHKPVQRSSGKRGRGRPRKQPELPKLKWHRPQGPGYYVAELPHGAKAEVEGSLKEGWTVVINGQEVNNAPVSKKEHAYELVNDALRQSMSV